MQSLGECQASTAHRLRVPCSDRCARSQLTPVRLGVNRRRMSQLELRHGPIARPLGSRLGCDPRGTGPGPHSALAPIHHDPSHPGPGGPGASSGSHVTARVAPESTLPRLQTRTSARSARQTVLCRLGAGAGAGLTRTSAHRAGSSRVAMQPGRVRAAPAPPAGIAWSRCPWAGPAARPGPACRRRGTRIESSSSMVGLTPYVCSERAERVRRAGPRFEHFFGCAGRI